MRLLDKMDWTSMTHEYGVVAKRLMPWRGIAPPFGGAWAIVEAGTTSLDHVNEPSDEEELFICIRGRGIAHVGDQSMEISAGDVIYLPPGKSHYIENPYGEDCHVYCLWWNERSIAECITFRKSNS